MMKTKAHVNFTIVLSGDVTTAQFKEWIIYQFGHISSMRESNPMYDFELRDAEVEPFYTLNEEEP